MDNSKINLDNNYLFSMYNTNSVPNKISLTKVDNNNYNIRFNDGKEELYYDPDDRSQTLYKDLQLYCNHRNKVFKSNQPFDVIDKIYYGGGMSEIRSNNPHKEKNGTGRLCLKIVQKEQKEQIEEIILSSDFIGISITYLKEFIENGSPNDERQKPSDERQKIVADYLKDSRTFAGHIMWPIGFGPKVYTINQAKGGKYGVFDRFDWTLKLLKENYKIIISNDKKSYDPSNSIFGAFERSANYFKLFGSFENFVDFWNLRESFVDIEYNVVPILDDWFPLYPNDLSKYIDKSKDMINKRKKILNSEKSGVSNIVTWSSQ